MWDYGENFDGAPFRGTDLPADIYTWFNRGIGPSPWVDEDSAGTESNIDPEETTEGDDSSSRLQKKEVVPTFVESDEVVMEKDEASYDGESSASQLFRAIIRG